MKKITLKWLQKEKACDTGQEWFNNQSETIASKVVLRLGEERHWGWADWLLGRLLSHKQNVQYAVFAAEQFLAIYETRYPEDKRPRAAIEAATAWIKRPSKKNKNAANAAAYAAANAAANAAYAAAYAAANAAAYAADAAADAAANAAAYAAAYAEMRMKILQYGVSLLSVKTKKRKAVTSR